MSLQIKEKAPAIGCFGSFGCFCSLCLFPLPARGSPPSAFYPALGIIYHVAIFGRSAGLLGACWSVLFLYRYNLSCFIAPWLLWLAFYGCFSSCPLVARLWAPDFSPEKGKALSFAFGFSASCGSGLSAGVWCSVSCRLRASSGPPVPAFWLCFSLAGIIYPVWLFLSFWALLGGC